jgi:hypothetical protein
MVVLSQYVQYAYAADLLGQGFAQELFSLGFCVPGVSGLGTGCEDCGVCVSRLAGRVCVVNGAASEIGRAVAGRFTAEGGVVVGVDKAAHSVGEPDQRLPFLQARHRAPAGYGTGRGLGHQCRVVPGRDRIGDRSDGLCGGQGRRGPVVQGSWHPAGAQRSTGQRRAVRADRHRGPASGLRPQPGCPGQADGALADGTVRARWPERPGQSRSSQATIQASLPPRRCRSTAASPKRSPCRSSQCGSAGTNSSGRIR